MAGNDSPDGPLDDPANDGDENPEPFDLSAGDDRDGDVEGDVRESDVREGDARDGDASDEVVDDREKDDATAPFEELDAEGDVDDPFAELDADAADSPREFPEEELEAAAGEVDAESDPFEEMEVEDLDEEDVWATLSEAEEPEVEIGGEARPIETEEGVEDHIVDKREYCQRCPYFTEPPTVACSHEGTEIVEAATTDEFRVRGCPMISEEGPTFNQE
ncbi:MAG: hypothetical protein ABEH81_13590 [Halopenitus sp.]